MKIKSKILPTVVLSAICIVVAVLLSVVNIFTAPKIEENEREKSLAAMKEIYPAGKSFEMLDISTLELPSEITEVYAVSDGGYVFKASVKGYSTGLLIMCGVDADGKITGSKYIESKETNGAEDKLNGAYNDQSLGTLSFEIVSGSTKTSNAYRTAIELSLKAFETLKNSGSVKGELPQ